MVFVGVEAFTVAVCFRLILLPELQLLLLLFCSCQQQKHWSDSAIGHFCHLKRTNNVQTDAVGKQAHIQEVNGRYDNLTS